MSRPFLQFLATFTCVYTTQSHAILWQEQPIVSCFFPCPYTPRTLPGNSLWWEESTQFYNFSWFAQCELSAAQTFRPERITQCLFGGGVENCYQTLCISGSHTTGRGTRKILLKEHHRTADECHTPIEKRLANSVDWLADYFWLPTDFISELRFKPVINTYRVAPSLHGAYSLNECSVIEADVYVPIEYTTWNLHVTEKIRAPGTNADDPGYFNATGIAHTQLEMCARATFAGYVPTIDGIIIMPLQYAKMSPCPLNKAAVNCAYLNVSFYSNPAPWILYGLGAILSIPGGTRPTGEFLFEPLVGDGHYWRYGIETYAQFYLFDDPIRQAWGLLTCDATLTSCAPSHQHRTFDLHNNPNSRYMLIHKPFASTPEYSYLANISTLAVKAHIRALFEISLTLTYATEKTNWSFGYRFWARSNDCLEIVDPCAFPADTWALKGDATVYGYAIPPGPDPAGMPQRIPTSEQKATVETGTNIPRGGSTDPVVLAAAAQNPHIDDPVSATTPGGQLLAATPINLTPTNVVNLSMPPVMLSIADLNLKSACSTGMLHTIFTILDTQLNCTTNHPAWHMYLRAEIECGKASTSIPPARFSQCINIAPSQWEVAWGLYVNF